MKKLLLIVGAFMLFGFVAKAELSKIDKPIEWKSKVTIPVSADKPVLQADGINNDCQQQLQQSSNKLLVTGLNSTVTNDDLAKLFSKFGELSEASVIVDGSGRSKGFAFVTFVLKEDAEKAVNELNQTKFKGRTIEVRFSPQGSNDPGRRGVRR